MKGGNQRTGQQRSDMSTGKRSKVQVKVWCPLVLFWACGNTTLASVPLALNKEQAQVVTGGANFGILRKCAHLLFCLLENASCECQSCWPWIKGTLCWIDFHLKMSMM